MSDLHQGCSSRVNSFLVVITAATCLLLWPDSSISSSSRQVRALTDIQTLESAIEHHRRELGYYPDEKTGISVLLNAERPPTTGYICRLPKDPWGNVYHYRQPGIHNPDSFDLWSNGADGVVGGEGANADCGNWPDSKKHCRNAYKSSMRFDEIFEYSVILVPIAFIIGLPLYIVGYALNRRSDRTAFIGFHLFVLLYLIFIFPLILFGKYLYHLI